jgi:hypothetical protein
MVWGMIMIKPEVTLLNQYQWKHIHWLNTLIDKTEICPQEVVSLVRISSPEGGIETQLFCTHCMRKLEIYGKEN